MLSPSRPLVQFGFQLGPGALFFLLAAESFPINIRDSALSFTQGVWWVLNILVVFLFPIMQEHVSIQWTLACFVATGVLSAVLIALVAKETKHDATAALLSPLNASESPSRADPNQDYAVEYRSAATSRADQSVQ